MTKRVSMLILASVLAALLIGVSPAFSQLTDNPDDTGSNQTPETDVAIKRAERRVLITNRWLLYYGDRSAKLRNRLERAATVIARIRRPAMDYLIVNAPEKALSLVLGRAQRFNLSDKITQHLESQVDVTGDVYRIPGIEVFDGQQFHHVDPEPTLLLSVRGQDFINPSVYGRRIEQSSKEGLPVHGIVLGEHFAWSADTFRWLDAQEKIENKVPAESDALFVGETVVVINSPKEFLELQAFLIGRENFPGPLLPEKLPESDDERTLFDRAWTNGVKTMLWVPVDLATAPGSDFTRSANTEFSVSHTDEWLRASSRDRTRMDVEYFPEVLRFPPETQSTFETNPSALVTLGRRALAEYDRAHGGTGRWFSTSFDRVIFVFGDALRKSLPDAVDPIARGRFSTDARFMVFYGLPQRFGLHHELGHTFLMSHINYWRPRSDDLAGAGDAEVMYYDHMGLGNDQRAHPSAGQKNYSYWIDDIEVIDASAGGSFRIVSHDRGPAGFVRALKIGTTDGREYWVDMRRLWDMTPALHQGVQIYWHEVPTRFVGAGNWFFAGPFSRATVFESPFQIGDVFTDTTRGVRITLDNAGMSPFAFGVFYADIRVERF